MSSFMRRIAGQSSTRVENAASELWTPLKQMCVTAVVGPVAITIVQWLLGSYAQAVINATAEMWPWLACRISDAWGIGWFCAKIYVFTMPVKAFVVYSVMNLYDPAEPGVLSPRNWVMAPSRIRKLNGVQESRELVESPQGANFEGSTPSAPDMTQHNVNASIMAKGDDGTYYMYDISATWAVWEKLRTAFISGSSLSVRDLVKRGHMSGGEARKVNAQIMKCEQLWGKQKGKKTWPSQGFAASVINREWAEPLPHPTVEVS